MGCAPSTEQAGRRVASAGSTGVGGGSDGSPNSSGLEIPVENVDESAMYGDSEHVAMPFARLDTADMVNEAGAASENLRRAMEEGRTDIRRTQVRLMREDACDRCSSFSSTPKKKYNFLDIPWQI